MPLFNGGFSNFVNNTVNTAVSGFTGLVNGVTAPVGTLLSSVVSAATPMVSNVSNSQLGASFGSGLSAYLTGGAGGLPTGPKSVGGNTPVTNLLGGLLGSVTAGGSQPQQTAPSKKTGVGYTEQFPLKPDNTFKVPFFNYYKVDEIKGLYVMDGDSPALNWEKIGKHVAAATGIGFVVYKLGKRYRWWR